MPDSADPMENRADPEMSHEPGNMISRLLRRRRVAGVALPKIRRRLAQVRRASGRIRKNRLVLPGRARRERIRDFSAALRETHVKGPRVYGRAIGKRRQAPWEQLDLSLPNGAPAESSRPNLLRAGLSSAGPFAGGQVIPPFSPPDEAGEPSFIERRQARLGAQAPKKPAPARKRLDPSSRLFSRVEEIKPSDARPAARGEEAPKAAEPPAAPKKPASSAGKPSTVQREMARGVTPLPQSPPQAPGAEPPPRVEGRQMVLPDAPREELQMELKRPAPQKPAVQPGVEDQRAPAPVDPAQKDRPQAAPTSRPEVKAAPHRQPERPKEAAPRPSPPSQEPAVEKAPERSQLAEPESRKAPVTSAPPATLQREPVEGGDLPAQRPPAEQEPARTAEAYQPLEQPLVQRQPLARQEERAAPETPGPPVQPARGPGPGEPIQPARGTGPGEPIRPAASKPAGRPAEKPLAPARAEKPATFRPVLFRLKRKPGRAAQPGIRTAPRPVAGKPVAAPRRIFARAEVNLIHRQVRRAPSGSSSRQAWPVVESLQTRPPGVRQPRPLRLSLRPLTASAAKPVRSTAPSRRQSRSVTNEKPAGVRAAVEAKHLPVLLSQRVPLPRPAAKTPRQGSRRAALPAQRIDPVLRERAPRPDSTPPFSLSIAPGGGHPWGEKMLVTHPGRQLIQRQLRRQAPSPVEGHPARETWQDPSAPSSPRQRAILPETILPAAPASLLAPRQETPAQAPEPRMRRAAEGLKTVVKPARRAEKTNRPAAELPVVQHKKASLPEQPVQPEVAVPGPVVQRRGSGPAVTESAQPDADSDEKPDLRKLARDVYPIIKRMIAVEKERSSGRSY